MWKIVISEFVSNKVEINQLLVQVIFKLYKQFINPNKTYSNWCINTVLFAVRQQFRTSTDMGLFSKTVGVANAGSSA